MSLSNALGKYLRFNGASQKTPERILLDVGAGFYNYDFTKTYAENKAAGKCLGAIKDGSFTATPDIRNISIPGLPEHTMGLQECYGWTPTLKLGLYEQTKENLLKILNFADAAAQTAGGADYDKIAPRDYITDEDYVENFVYVGKRKGTGEPVLVVLERGLNLGGLNWNFTDRSETISEVTYTGHYALGNDDELSDPPFYVLIPKEAANV